MDSRVPKARRLSADGEAAGDPQAADVFSRGGEVDHRKDVIVHIVASRYSAFIILFSEKTDGKPGKECIITGRRAFCKCFFDYFVISYFFQVF